MKQQTMKHRLSVKGLIPIQLFQWSLAACGSVDKTNPSGWFTISQARRSCSIVSHFQCSGARFDGFQRLGSGRHAEAAPGSSRKGAKGSRAVKSWSDAAMN